MFGPQVFDWAGWVSMGALTALTLIVAVGRWRAEGWPGVRRVWWWLAFILFAVAVRLASELNLV